MKRIHIAAFLFTLALLTGLIHISLSGNPEYEKVNKKAEDASYHVSYNVKLSGTPGSGVINYEDFEVYRSGDVVKQEVVWTGGVFDEGRKRRVSYHKDNRTVVCWGSPDSEGVNTSTCKTGETNFAFFQEFGRNAAKKDPEYNGTHRILGRPCHSFRFNAETNKTPAKERLEGPARFNICIDSEEGFISAMSIDGNVKSPLSGVNEAFPEEGTYTRIASIMADSVQTDYNREISVPEVN